MLGILPLEDEQPIADRSNLFAKARQAAIVRGRTIVIEGYGCIGSSGNPKLVDAVNSGTAALTVDLDVDVVAVLSGPPGILARLE